MICICDALAKIAKLVAERAEIVAIFKRARERFGCAATLGLPSSGKFSVFLNAFW